MEKRKIIINIIFIVCLCLILFYLTSYFFGNPYRFSSCDPCGCPQSEGFPLHYYQTERLGSGLLENEKVICGESIKNYNYFYLILDIVIWIIVSSFVVLGFNKLLNK